jgi:hypothetical protein
VDEFLVAEHLEVAEEAHPQSRLGSLGAEQDATTLITTITTTITTTIATGYLAAIGRRVPLRALLLESFLEGVLEGSLESIRGYAPGAEGAYHRAVESAQDQQIRIPFEVVSGRQFQRRSLHIPLPTPGPRPNGREPFLTPVRQMRIDVLNRCLSFPRDEPASRNHPTGSVYYTDEASVSPK